MENKKDTFHVVLIKPSKYDDDGYVIQWRRTFMPSNTLSCVRGLIEEAAGRNVLGPDVDIVVEDFDEYSGIVPTKKIIESIRKATGGIVMMVGVQTNQFPRSIDLARHFRKVGIPVMIGGFHVSGCVAMIPDWDQGLKAARDLGISLFAGELEGHAETLLNDAFQGELKPLYNFLGKLPDLKTAPMPSLSLAAVRRTCLSVTGFDLGRGCPFKCSFCTIINVQGRKTRARSVEKVVDYIRRSNSLGISHYLVSDDNFARNEDWEGFLDAFIQLREKEGISMDLFIQVDTQATRIPGFVEKAKRAGCTRVFIGVESVRQDNLNAASKRQNKAEELRKMVLPWRQAGILTYTSFIIGFPGDTVESIEEDMSFIKQNIPTDIIVFSILTPLPGSEDHKRLFESGVFMEQDLNKYDSEHLVTYHPNIKPDEMEDLYWRAWDIFYTPEHLETLFKRAAATGIPVWDVFTSGHGYSANTRYDKTTPLQSGIFRRKVRRDRRPGLPIEPWISFYLRRTGEIIMREAKSAALAWKLYRIMKKAVREVEKNGYSDAAIKGFEELKSEMQTSKKSEWSFKN